MTVSLTRFSSVRKCKKLIPASLKQRNHCSISESPCWGCISHLKPLGTMGSLEYCSKNAKCHSRCNSVTIIFVILKKRPPNYESTFRVTNTPSVLKEWVALVQQSKTSLFLFKKQKQLYLIGAIIQVRNMNEYVNKLLHHQCENKLLTQ